VVVVHVGRGDKGVEGDVHRELVVEPGHLRPRFLIRAGLRLQTGFILFCSDTCASPERVCHYVRIIHLNVLDNS
jgi:hypothetical protein